MQQNRIIKHKREQGRASHYQNKGQPKIYGGNAIWNKCLEFFSENSSNFRCFQSDEQLIPDPRHSNRESTFIQVKFCFRHNKL